MMKGKLTYALLLMLRKLMIQYGGMGYGVCGKWVVMVRFRDQ